MEIDGTELIHQHIELERLDEKGIQDYIGDQIRTMSLIESKIQSTRDKAKTALQKANDAQGKIKAFHKKEAIEKLQQAALAQSEALEEVVQCNTCIFDNQKALSEVSKRLFVLGVGNMARNRVVVKKISDYLEGMNSGDSNSMMKGELISIVSELNSQLDLMQRVQNISQGLDDMADAVSMVRMNVDEMKRELDKKDKDLNETRKIAENAMKQVIKVSKNNNVGIVSKKINVGIWVLCGIIVIAVVSLTLIFGNFSF